MFDLKTNKIINNDFINLNLPCDIISCIKFCGKNSKLIFCDESGNFGIFDIKSNYLINVGNLIDYYKQRINHPVLNSVDFYNENDLILISGGFDKLLTVEKPYKKKKIKKYNMDQLYFNLNDKQFFKK